MDLLRGVCKLVLLSDLQLSMLAPVSGRHEHRESILVDVSAGWNFSRLEM